VILYPMILILILMEGSLVFSIEKSDSATHSIEKLEDITNQIQMETVMEETFDYAYASFGRPDPFIPNTHPSHLPRISVLITSILQRYPLDRIRVVGIWKLQNGDKKSLMMTEKSEGVVVSMGDPVGMKGGKIKSIESDHVVVQEVSLDSEGTPHFLERTIWLGSHEEKKAEKTISLQSTSDLAKNADKITDPASSELKNEN
jgi:hypothetical protein